MMRAIVHVLVVVVLASVALAACNTTKITSPTCSPRASASAGGGGGGGGSASGEGGAGAPGDASAEAGADCTPGTVENE